MAILRKTDIITKIKTVDLNRIILYNSIVSHTLYGLAFILYCTLSSWDNADFVYVFFDCIPMFILFAFTQIISHKFLLKLFGMYIYIRYI